MKVRELVRRVEAAGWRLERKARGSHRIYKHPDRRGILVIPDHAGKDLAPGTVSQILKDAGIT